MTPRVLALSNNHVLRKFLYTANEMAVAVYKAVRPRFMGDQNRYRLAACGNPGYHAGN